MKTTQKTPRTQPIVSGSFVRKNGLHPKRNSVEGKLVRSQQTTSAVASLRLPTQSQNYGERPGHSIVKRMFMLPAIALLSAPSALAMPLDSSSVYGKGMVLQTPSHVALPEAVNFSGSQFSIESDRFLGIESLKQAELPITPWQTTLPVTMPNGQAAVATFYGSTDYPIATPGTAVQRGFTLPNERITFSTDPQFLRTSGLSGILPGDAFSAPTDGSSINPTEFGNAYIKGGMSTSANWMVVRDDNGNVLFQGTPATYGAQLYWDGKTAQLSDAEGLNIGESHYKTIREHSTQTDHETEWEQRSRQQVVINEGLIEGRNTWNAVDTQQRAEVSVNTQPFMVEEKTQVRQSFTSDLASVFPLPTVAILQRDLEMPGQFKLRTNFQLGGDISNDSHPSVSGQLRIPLDTQKGTSSLNILVGGAPHNDQPGQPDFYALLFAQLNTSLFHVKDGQYRPSPVVAGVRFGGGIFHVPVAAQTVTQTISRSGVDVISERRTFNDFTTTTWGQDFRTPFTQTVTNHYLDTYRIDTTQTTSLIHDITDVVVTRTDGSTFIAPDYRTISEQQGETTSQITESLANSELVASSASIQPGKTQVSDPFVLSQQTASQLVGVDATTQRIVENVSVKQTVSNQADWGEMLFINPYLGNFDLATVLHPGSFLYEVGGNFVRSSLLSNVSYKDSNLYLSAGMPLLNTASAGRKDAGTGLLTLRAQATYLPMSNDVKVGVGLQWSGW